MTVLVFILVGVIIALLLIIACLLKLVEGTFRGF